MMTRPEIKLLRALVLGAIFCSGIFVVQASEVGSSADVIEAKSWGLSVYGSESKIEPKFKLSGVSGISVPISGGGSTTLFGNTDAEIEMEQRSAKQIAVAEFRPGDGLKYRVKLGLVQDFSLEYSSGSQVNKLESTSSGLVWGLGISGSFAPGSIVSTAIGWDLNYTETNLDVDRFEAGPVVSATSEKFREQEIQGSIGFSRRFKQVEPYAGIKMLYVMSQLRDDSTKEKVSGHTELFSPYAGLQWRFAERESLVVEGSFIGEESLTAGLKVQF